MPSGPYKRFYPGEARGLLDPTWPGVTERDIRETWRRSLEAFNERQREKKRERVREVYGTAPPPKRGLLDSEPYTSEWFEGMSDRAYVDSGLRPEHMVGPMAGVRRRVGNVIKISPAADALKATKRRMTEISIEKSRLNNVLDAFEDGIPGISARLKTGRRPTIDDVRQALESRSFTGDIPNIRIGGQEMSIRNPGHAVRLYEHILSKTRALDDEFTKLAAELVN